MKPELEQKIRDRIVWQMQKLADQTREFGLHSRASQRTEAYIAALKPWSCDFRPTEIPGQHIQGNVFEHEVIERGWDLMIAHPDCTFLTVSGARWMRVEWREEAQLMALHCVKALWKFPIEKLAIENPVGKLSSLWRGPDQIIQPYQFGDPFKKTTCLWLKNLPQLLRTNDLGTGEQACWKEAPSDERKKNRSRTYQGIAAAMAEQWG